MATGQILFTGKSNNEMLQQIQESCGSVPLRMIKEAEYAKKHFNVAGDFLRKDKNEITQQVEEAVMSAAKFNKVHWGDRLTRIANPQGQERSEFEQQVLLLGDLVGKALCCDPKERIWPEQAVQHEAFKQQ